MANNVITTALLIIAGITAAMILISAVFPAIFQMTGTFSSVASDMNDKMLTDAGILFTQPEKKVIHVWLKNTGRNEIPYGLLESSDISIVSFSKENVENRYLRVPYKRSGVTKPYWTYTFEDINGDYWGRGENIEVEVSLRRPLETGVYTIQFMTYNGFIAEDVFSVGR